MDGATLWTRPDEGAAAACRSVSRPCTHASVHVQAIEKQREQHIRNTCVYFLILYYLLPLGSITRLPGLA